MKFSLPMTLGISLKDGERRMELNSEAPVYLLGA